MKNLEAGNRKSCSRSCTRFLPEVHTKHTLCRKQCGHCTVCVCVCVCVCGQSQQMLLPPPASLLSMPSQVSSVLMSRKWPAISLLSVSRTVRFSDGTKLASQPISSSSIVLILICIFSWLTTEKHTYMCICALLQKLHLPFTHLHTIPVRSDSSLHRRAKYWVHCFSNLQMIHRKFDTGHGLMMRKKKKKKKTFTDWNI